MKITQSPGSDYNLTVEQEIEFIESLSNKELDFLSNYARGMTAYIAAIRAGYSVKEAKKATYWIDERESQYSKPKLKALLKVIKKEFCDLASIDANWHLAEALTNYHAAERSDEKLAYLALIGKTNKISKQEQKTSENEYRMIERDMLIENRLNYILSKGKENDN